MKRINSVFQRKAAALICAAAFCLCLPFSRGAVSAGSADLQTAGNGDDAGALSEEARLAEDARIAEEAAARFIPNNDWPDGGPVIGEGEFVPDPEMLAIIAEKEAGIFIPNNDWPDGGPVIGEGEFVPDPEMLAIIAEKEAAMFGQKSEADPCSNDLAIPQMPQETEIWSGYAAIQSLLSFEGITKTQTQIANSVYSTDSACPWYLANENTLSQFPAAGYLNSQISGYNYVPYPYGDAGASPPTESELKTRVKYTINNGHGVLACGTSNASTAHESHLPMYPAASISHWIVVKGYSSYGDNVLIADPVKSSAVSWSGSIEAKYDIPLSKLTAFVAPKGIIY